MSQIEVRRTHALETEEAGRRVRRMIEDFQAKSSTFEGVEVVWAPGGMSCDFSGEGLEGSLLVEPGAVTIKLELKGMMSMFRSVARDRIGAELERNLAAG